MTDSTCSSPTPAWSGRRARAAAARRRRQRRPVRRRSGATSTRRVPRTVVDAAGRPTVPRRRRRPPALGHLQRAGEDAGSESRAAAQGGVTTGITYIRTGAYYMNRTGPYREIFPDVLAAAEGRAYVDYGFHVAPIMKEHIDEIPDADRASSASPRSRSSCSTAAHGLHGRSSDQSSFLMIPEGESYDFAHFEFVMRGMQAARQDDRYRRGPRRHLAVAALRDRRDHAGLHQARRGGGHA